MADHSVPTAAEVREVLGRLGDTPDAIAETLADEGVKGSRGRVEDCPIANYLSQQFSRRATWGGTNVLFDGEDYASVCTHDHAAALFTAGFDNGYYPELER